MIAIKTETKKYGDAIRLYYKDEKEYSDWIEKLKYISDKDNISDESKKDIETLILKIEKRKTIDNSNNTKTYGEVNTLLFISELTLLTTVFMKMVFYLNDVIKLNEESEALIANILDGKEGI